MRPVLKEFNFDPPTHMISLAEGATQEFVLKAVKVAFRLVFSHVWCWRGLFFCFARADVGYFVVFTEFRSAFRNT